MVRVQVICDVCKSAKGDNNHWWLLYPSDPETVDGITLEPLGEVDPNIDPGDDLHLCGHNCIMKIISEYTNHNLIFKSQQNAASMAEVESSDT